MFTDKTLTCVDCGQQFVFSASEQDFFTQRGFSDPRRCSTCRASRKAAGGRSGTGRESFGSGGFGGDYAPRERGPREMFAATCSACGRETQVPFRPTSGKPVYCDACFASRR